MQHLYLMLVLCTDKPTNKPVFYSAFPSSAFHQLNPDSASWLPVARPLNGGWRVRCGLFQRRSGFGDEANEVSLASLPFLSGILQRDPPPPTTTQHHHHHHQHRSSLLPGWRVASDCRRSSFVRWQKHLTRTTPGFCRGSFKCTIQATQKFLVLFFRQGGCNCGGRVGRFQ